MKFADGPAHTVVDRNTGRPLQGRRIRIYTAYQGTTEITALVDLAGNPLAQLLSDDLGRYPFQILSENWPVVWAKDPAGNWWRLVGDAGIPQTDLPDWDELQDYIDTAASNAAGSVVYAKEYGAVGDGITDDTAALQAAVDAVAPRGGHVRLERGAKHRLVGAVELKSNVVIDGAGAELFKTNPVDTYEVMITRSHGATGYGSSANNITVRDLSVRGDFDGMRGAAITLQHSQNVLFENCNFYECIIGGHALDLGGCDGVTIRDCGFYGVKGAKDYTEAIQIDNAYRLGNAVDDDTLASYDGLPTINVLVDGCKFMPYEVSGVVYPAPNPIGAHARVLTQWFDNIKFVNNHVRDAEATAPTQAEAPGFAHMARGWIHFFHARNILISGNTFEVTDGRSAQVIRTQTLADGTAMSDVKMVDPPTTATTDLQPCSGWKIIDNDFIGFRNTYEEPLIHLIGRSSLAAGGAVRDVRIQGNTLRNCFQGGSNTGSVLFKGTIVDRVTIADNQGDLVAAVATIDTSKAVCISGNQFDQVGSGIALTTVTGVRVEGNRFDAMTKTGPALSATSCNDLRVCGNDLDTSFTSDVVVVSGGENLIILGNRIQGGDAGIAVSNATRGRVADNIVQGSVTPIELTSNTGVTQVDNLTS